MELTSSHLLKHQNQLIQTLSQVEQQEQCVAHLAIGQVGMKLEANDIWQATSGSIDILIVGICADGLAAMTTQLKQRKPHLQTIVVELVSHLSLADTHPVFQTPLSAETGIVSEAVLPHWSSEVILIRNDEAVVSGRRLAQTEGLRNDIATCTLLCAAVRVGQRLESKGKSIFIFPSNPNRFTLPLNHPWR